MFARQAQADLDLIHRFMAMLDEKRVAGAGKLKAASSFTDFSYGEAFLDGFVHVVPPKPDQIYELLVVGDLHGCYSCFKAALLQSDFFTKVQAWRNDPAQPYPMAVFLGDYIDRGRFSYNGVLRGVMQLALAAPDHVVALRGNHEYYVQVDGRVLAPVRPAEAMLSIENIAPMELLAGYMRLFESLPNALVFDRMMFVHGGIPRDDTMAAKLLGPDSLNDPEIRFQMLWSDPSPAEYIPLELQKANARFPFGKMQFRRFISRLGCSAMVRGHERLVEGFRKIVDEPGALLVSLFSAGGANNIDLPEESNYREVTPMALTIRFSDGVSQLTPFLIDYERYNDPRYNAFFAEGLLTER